MSKHRKYLQYEESAIQKSKERFVKKMDCSLLSLHLPTQQAGLGRRKRAVTEKVKKGREWAPRKLE